MTHVHFVLSSNATSDHQPHAAVLCCIYFYTYYNTTSPAYTYIYIVQVNGKKFDFIKGIYGWYKKQGDNRDGWMDVAMVITLESY